MTGPKRKKTPEQKNTEKNEECLNLSHLPMRHPNRIALEYLKDFDMVQAMRRAGYTTKIAPRKERLRAERMWYSTRFQRALRTEWNRRRLRELGRVAGSGDTNAALRALDQLDSLLTQDMGKTADGTKWSE